MCRATISNFVVSRDLQFTVSAREGACNSAYACRDSKMLVITKNITKMHGRVASAACVDLQAVGTLEFFGELYSLAEGFGPFLSVFGRKGGGGYHHFAISTGIINYVELHVLSLLRGSISLWGYQLLVQQCCLYRVCGSK